ncbi:SusC/RagA family TonB-linked outer membrane protein [Fulvivirga ligni]|uniref:SusC/RagA family TonB-linked outer membrane protein n=1 Tax=Fulvivirga ligni TaxID=2904246 RepID=UPI001F3F2D65|nr:SusC/RagA family TonB-linked outer membrane protein [Fulvivirga ligni]UII19530.1 SusC/RagA family TonB-linked outer membrane protein [Fulvivirga ligni]
MKKLLLNFVVIMVCGFYSAMAQKQTVTGKVTSAADGNPLPGVSVLEQGTTNGTVTDIEGNFSMSVTDGANLVFSFIGYKNQVVPVNGRTTFNIALDENVTELTEVVVVGYGTVEAKDATGAVTSISSEDFNKGVITSPEELIQGRSAGVQVTSSSGEPGSGMNIRIRGTSSIRSGNNPLYVIDGVPLSGSDASSSGTDVGFGSSSARNPLSFMNPNDIESISILKDASATAIYGSRGANGVILITTKKGKGKTGVLNYSSSVSFSSITKKYDLLSRDEFLDGAESLGADRSAIDLGADTDWQDEVLRTAISHNHNLSYGGSGNDGNYRLSLSYLDQEGIVKTSGLQRVTARVNANKSFWDDKLNISSQITVSRVHDDNVPVTNNSGFRGDLLGAMIISNPTRPVYNPDGTYNQPGVDQLNPVAMLNLRDDYTNTLRSLGSFTLEYEITKGLTFNTSLGLDHSSSSRKAAYSSDLVAAGIQGVGRGGYLDLAENNLITENYFNYQKELGSSKLNLLLGYSYQQFNYETKSLLARNYRTPFVDIMINNVSSATQFLANTSKTKDELQSFYGRVNYDINDKYLLTATVRADGSTKFGENNKYGVFPSFAFAWRLSEESFTPDAFSDLKLRLGYGITGNQEIPNNLVYQRQRWSDYGFNENGSTNGGTLGSVAFENPDLKWESTSQINFGLDYGFADNKVVGSLDFYHKTTNDLLIQVTSAQPAPQPFVWQNLGADIINKGVELSLEVVAVDNESSSWNIMGNVGYNKNLVKNYASITNTGEINGQGLSNAYAQRIANDQPLYAYYLREFQGYDSEGLSVYAGGDVQQFTGDSPLPKVTAGLTNRLRYKNFDLNFFFSGMFGQKIYNNTANAYFTAGSLAIGRNVDGSVADSGESPLNAPDVSTRFLEDGSFVRLQNFTLGYNITPQNSDVVSSVRLFLTGQNLFIITGYSGQDPEVNTNKAIDGIPSFGIDYTPYPRARTITFGVNLSL